MCLLMQVLALGTVPGRVAREEAAADPGHAEIKHVPALGS